MSTQAVPRSRAITGFVLSAFAVALCPLAMWLIDAELIAAGDTRWRTATITLAVGTHVIYLVSFFRARYADPLILPLVVALNSVGLAMIYRIDLTTSADAGESQVMWTGVAMGAAMLVLVALKNHRVLRKVTYISLAVSIVLLLLPLIPRLGLEINGARIWVSVAGRTFQPGEIAKITLAIFFAGYLSTHRDLILLAGKRVGPVHLPRFKDLAPMFIAWLVSIGVLVFQRDLGSAILFFGLFMAMLFLATGQITWIALGLLFVAAGGFLAYNFISHVHYRISSWIHAFDPEVYNQPVGGSGQIVQGVFGLASGGLFGRGWGSGRPDLVAYSNSDMIVTALGEELGLLGLGAILMVFLLLVSRGFRAALGVRDAFGKLLAAGLSAVIVLQLFVVIGGVTRLIPLTGLTTPFMSAGGSSLLANWVIAALLIAISHSARAPQVVDAFSDQDAVAGSIAASEGHEGATSVISRISDEQANAAGGGR
ncbi:FtsW/RodA/SpoVE family cell cycle protein [Rothia sp. ZJ1223]|uniref:FtsW/RodA/SpoVE family cell cycle protein n=1 Tax=Rothia sp. ZJ1223 TaxID=2811098 RepID=UPI00195BF902|nr:FtsW/RodA/SpoVE family cell cycle protein [Rothia sp. ZJ1223]MBM7052275.1 FtsW/RodA/SpoVE family cell cycle protein [Rothia sp. ZJ1223]